MITDVATELAAIKNGDTVTFSYTMKNGQAGRVHGTAAGLIMHRNGTVEGIRVDITPAATDPAIAAAAIAASGRVGFAPARITGLDVTPAPARNGNGLATGRQIRYALSLCERSGNFYRPSETDMRTMTSREISAWIDMAKDEL